MGLANNLPALIHNTWQTTISPNIGDNFFALLVLPFKCAGKKKNPKRFGDDVADEEDNKFPTATLTFSRGFVLSQKLFCAYVFGTPFISPIPQCKGLIVINGGDCAIMLTWHKWFHLSESAFLTTLSRIIVFLSVNQTTAAGKEGRGGSGGNLWNRILLDAACADIYPFCRLYFEIYISIGLHWCDRGEKK